MSAAGRSAQIITYSRVVHLSHLIDPGISQWPDDPSVQFQTVAEVARDGYRLLRLSLGEHAGTHRTSHLNAHLRMCLLRYVGVPHSSIGSDNDTNA